MDAKVFRMALLTIFSAFILVLVIIYATNTDKINRLFGKRDNSSASAASVEASVDAQDKVYGQQIGDDLKSFLYDESFFDESEEIPAVVVIKKNYNAASSSSSLNSEEDNEGTGMAVVGQLENPEVMEPATEFSVDTDMVSPVGVIPTP